MHLCFRASESLSNIPVYHCIVQVSEGLRLPEDFEPISYDIGLVPELFPSTSTHKQRSFIVDNPYVQVPRS